MLWTTSYLFKLKCCLNNKEKHIQVGKLNAFSELQVNGASLLFFNFILLIVKVISLIYTLDYIQEMLRRQSHFKGADDRIGNHLPGVLTLLGEW